MRYQLTVFGAGSYVGKSLCRRAVRLGWDVNAFSIEDIRPRKRNYRRQIFYNDDLNWREHLTWNASYNYDGKLERLHDEVKNCTGVVLLYEPTPMISSGKTTFEANAVKLAKLCGEWSVRHLICVEDIANGGTITQETEDEIGDTNDLLIVSLIRANKIYSYDSFKTCLSVFRNRTLRSVGIETDPIDAINSETIATAVTTLIHDSSDTNVYKILDKNGIEAYLREKNIAFDSPEEQHRFYDIDDSKDDSNSQGGTVRYGFESADYEHDSDDYNVNGDSEEESDSNIDTDTDTDSEQEQQHDNDNNDGKSNNSNVVSDENGKQAPKLSIENENFSNDSRIKNYKFNNRIGDELFLSDRKVCSVGEYMHTNFVSNSHFSNKSPFQGII